jgi:hypothetical protein
MLLALAGAAVAQDLLPGMPGTPLKIPFLTGVVVYYALNRPLVMALVAALWAGMLTDGAGGLPGACTAVFLFLAALALRPLRRLLLDGSFTGVTLATTVLALAQALWQWLWSDVQGLDGEEGRALARLALLLPSGAVAGAAAALALRFLEQWAGNARPRGGEAHGTA